MGPGSGNVPGKAAAGSEAPAGRLSRFSAVQSAVTFRKGGDGVMSDGRARTRTSLAVLGVVLALAAAMAVFHAPWRAVPPEMPSTAPSSASLSVYFNQPAGARAQTLRGGPDQTLAAAIEVARYDVDVAIYSLDLWSIRDALIRAHARGVGVRVVTESDGLLVPEVEALVRAGIPVRGDGRESLMHHKFTVIDRYEVWAGSMNYTVAAAYRDDNNLLRLRSAEVAEDFTREFEEMFSEDRFGALSRADTPHAQTVVEGVPVEVLFSPDDGVEARLLALIRGARRSVDFLAFTFTSDALAEALIERAHAGAAIRGVLERSQARGAGAEYDRLLAAGVDVRLDGNPDVMHHKVLILDGAIVVTGSYNFTRSAEEDNDEDVLIVHDPALASAYLAEFERVWALAGP
jgi:phosphatidylserine/phosphatidylglycerophosphate/cardiolipin synthase-like enzyme